MPKIGERCVHGTPYEENRLLRVKKSLGLPAHLWEVEIPLGALVVRSNDNESQSSYAPKAWVPSSCVHDTWRGIYLRYNRSETLRRLSPETAAVVPKRCH